MICLFPLSILSVFEGMLLDVYKYLSFHNKIQTPLIKYKFSLNMYLFISSAKVNFSSPNQSKTLVVKVKYCLCLHFMLFLV